MTMTYTLSQKGYFVEARQYEIHARRKNEPKKDAAGNVVLDPKTGKPVMAQTGDYFTPVTRGLHPDIAKRYGTIPACVIHCTDVIADAGALARRTAETSPRESSYNLLIGMDGDLHQLASVYDRTWHAGRSYPSPKYEGTAVLSAIRAVGNAKGADVYRGEGFGPLSGWIWPVVDGVRVVNPNNWAVGIEIMGKPGMPTSAQLDTLRQVLLELFAKTAITPERVWEHGDLDPLNRTDPGFDVAAFVRSILPESAEARENDGWNARGDDDAPADPIDPASGPAPAA